MSAEARPRRIVRVRLVVAGWASLCALGFVLTQKGDASGRGLARGSSAAAPATQPASAEDNAKRVSQAIDRLGSDDFSAREHAARELWEIGDAALPALKEAAASGHPEVARRARSILASFAFGIRPDTPKAVVDQLNAYRQGDPAARREAIAELSRQGSHGARVLLKLSGEEPDPQLKKLAQTGLAFLARPTVAAMAAEGDWTTAARLLESVAPLGEQPARDYAAFLLLRGQLETAEPRLADHPIALAMVRRAKGDPRQAARSADEANEPSIADALLAEAGDYAELVKRLERRDGAGASIESRGYLMTYQRLAGLQAASDNTADQLVREARQSPGEHTLVAEALLLNGYAGRTMRFLPDLDPPLAMEFAGPRFDYEMADRIVTKVIGAETPERARVVAMSAPLLHQRGRTKEATQRLEEVATGKFGPVDLPVWQAIIEAAPMSGLPIEKADEWLAQALSAGNRRPGDSADRLWQRARFLDSGLAQKWWNVLRDHRVGNSPAEAMALVRRLDRRLVTGDEFAKLLERTRELASTLLNAERVGRLMLIADTLVAYGRETDAIAELEQIIAIDGGGGSELSFKLGGLLARSKQWDRAAEHFSAAMKADPEDARPVALLAWCRREQGKPAEADHLMAIAHLMPLADESARNELATTLTQHGLKEDARRERELIVRVGELGSWGYADALRRLAIDVARTDPTKAADMWDRAFLANLSVQTSFVDPTANLTIPVLVQRQRAIGHARAGRTERAVEVAANCLEAYPSDADTQIAVVRALDRAGHAKVADDVFRRAFDRYDAIRKTYPDSAQAHNLVAWLCGCVGRELDHGLAMARRGVELDPKNSAILDTLSEVHYARNEFDEALKINAQCQSMEPYVEHHKKNHARFTAAKAGKKPQTDGTELDGE